MSAQRTIGLLLIVGLIGCTALGGRPSEQPTRTARCPACDVDYVWSYDESPSSFEATEGKRVVVHRCPGCQRPWWALLDQDSRCRICLREGRVCPADADR